MLNVDQLCSDALRSLGWTYVSPGTNDSNGIDCSGLLVYCFKKQGASIYHGSNSIFRKSLTEKRGKITSTNQLEKGMVVFKWRQQDTTKYPDGQGDFYHIGIVLSRDPIQIIHASSAKGKVVIDTSIGAWTHYGRLNGVDYSNSDKSTPLKATVKADSGYTVNIRKSSTSMSDIVTQVPIGKELDVTSKGDVWCAVTYAGKSGYMMTKYLKFNEADSSDTTYVTMTQFKKLLNRVDQLERNAKT